MNLSKNVKVVGSSLGVPAAASTSQNSHWIDTQGFNGCMMIVKGSTLAGGTSGFGTWTLTARHAASKSTLVWGSIGTVTSTAILAAAGTNRIMTFDVYKPLKRYLRFTITGSSVGTYEFIPVLYEPRRPGHSSACGPLSTTTWAGSTCVASKAT
jgi:hypothetical protein